MMTRLFERLPAVLLSAAVFLVTAGATGAVTPHTSNGKAPQLPGKQRTKVIETSYGPVRGFVDGGMRKFLGIPFAAAPVGDLRWRPPQPPASWSAPLDAVAFGHTCAQNPSIQGFAAASEQEDCLFLNVVTPREGSGRDQAGAPRRPVMVWIYGGGLTGGESDDYAASKLVKQGGVVFVSINYRLNVFGFFSHPSLNSEGHPAGNYGLMDQQFALLWVQRNISSFGGDPKNVTIFGESAGANSAWAHIGSPASAGLFHKAILESSSGVRTLANTLQSREALGQAFAVNAGCADQTAPCLRSRSAPDLLAANLKASGASGLTVDGTIIRVPLLTAITAGQFNRVPLIAGTNRDENTWFQGNTELRTGHIQTIDDVEKSIAATFGKNAAAVSALYPVRNYSTPTNALAAVTGDRGFICGTRRSLQLLSGLGVTTFGYEFADRSATAVSHPVSFPTLAAHTAEIPFLFPRFHGATAPVVPLTAKQQRLSDQMVSYWTTFARTGTPNSPKSGLAFWPRYDAARDDYQSLNIPRTVTIAPFGAQHNCDFWDRIDEVPTVVVPTSR